MTQPELLDLYCSLESLGKVRFLASCSYNLTVAMREFYGDDYVAETRTQSLMGANELQHHLTSELRHHNERDENRYPDDVLLNILFEKAAFYQISPQLGYALRQASQHINTT
jgi:hypothetical protein